MKPCTKAQIGTTSDMEERGADPIDNLTRKHYEEILSELDERVADLYQQARYADALKLAEKGAKIAGEKFAPGDFFVTIFSNNLLSIQKQITKERLSSAVEGKVYSKNTNALKIIVVLLLVLSILSMSLGLQKSTPDTSKLYANTTSVVGDAEDFFPYYHLKAAFNPQERTVQGEEDVVLETKAYTQEVVFNLYLNRYQNDGLNTSEMRKYAYKRGVDKGYIDIQQVYYQGEETPFKVDGELLKVSIKQELFLPGKQRIKIRFKVKIPLIADRVGGNDKGIWLGNWLPTLCTDPKGYKPTEVGDPYVNTASTYDLAFEVPKNYNLVISNVDSIQVNGDTKLYKGRLNKVRDLPVFLDYGYKEAKVEDGDTEIHFYYLSDGYQKEVLDTAKRAVAYFKGTVGEYPWKQLNIVENDMYLSGMEYSTMLLVSTKALQNNLAPTVFHEVGHQWFYNIIGSDQYHAPYLDEGAVEFFTTTVLNNRSSHYNSRIFGLNRDLSDFGSWQQYRDIHYNNGEKLFENLYVMMGKEKFQNFIKDYYEKYRFGFVTSDEFKAFLTQKIGVKATQNLFAQ